MITKRQGRPGSNTAQVFKEMSAIGSSKEPRMQQVCLVPIPSLRLSQFGRMSRFSTCSASSQRKRCLGGGNHTQFMCASLSECACVDGHLCHEWMVICVARFGGAHGVKMSC